MAQGPACHSLRDFPSTRPKLPVSRSKPTPTHQEEGTLLSIVGYHGSEGAALDTMITKGWKRKRSRRRALTEVGAAAWTTQIWIALPPHFLCAWHPMACRCPCAWSDYIQLMWLMGGGKNSILVSAILEPSIVRPASCQHSHHIDISVPHSLISNQ